MVTEEELCILLSLLDPTEAYPSHENSGSEEYQQSSDMQRIILQSIYLLANSGILYFRIKR
jgi:hypothetical protein